MTIKHYRFLNLQKNIIRIIQIQKTRYPYYPNAENSLSALFKSSTCIIRIIQRLEMFYPRYLKDERKLPTLNAEKSLSAYPNAENDLSALSKY